MMVNHHLYLITITAVAFVIFGLSITNRVIIRTTTSSNILKDTKVTTNEFPTTKTTIPSTVRKNDEAQWKNNRNVTLVVHLPGTLGRILGAIAAARVVQIIAKRDFSIDTQLVFRVHKSPRGVATAKNLQTCFPSLILFASFRDGAFRELENRKQQVYEKWDYNITGPLLELPATKDGVRQSLQMLQTMLVEESSGLFLSADATISLPFLQMNESFYPNDLIDSSDLEEIRHFLKFNHDNCCELVPDQDETVLHVHGYRRRRNKLSVTDLELRSKTANWLLGHLQNGSKVAVLAPFHSDTYVSALASRGLLVRNVSQSDTRDFCFLLHVKKELVAEVVSSYAVWAATLNTGVESIRLYNIEPHSRKTVERIPPITVSWLSSVQRSRIQYVSESADETSMMNSGDDTASVSQSTNDGDDGHISKVNESKTSAYNFPPTTIVVQLSGELGNNLAKLATGKGLQLWARREYGIESELVLRHQDHSKWVHGMKDMKQCFPNFRDANFELGNGPNFYERKGQQDNLFGSKSALLRLSSARVEDIEETLSTLSDIFRGGKYNTTDRGLTDNITLPFLLADYLSMIDVWIDKFYDDYRELFAFDYEKCCKLKPEPDETVFHFRNYATEMPNHYKGFGFEELSPNKTSNELFRDLKAGDKIAITSRFIADASVRGYVDAFKSRGIKVRIIEGQTGVEDFCFLLAAKKELVGYAESSYAIWAGYLGNAEKVRFYSVDSPARRATSSLFHHRVFYHFNWTNPKLQAKVFFELHPAEDS